MAKARKPTFDDVCAEARALPAVRGEAHDARVRRMFDLLYVALGAPELQRHEPRPPAHPEIRRASRRSSGWTTYVDATAREREEEAA